MLFCLCLLYILFYLCELFLLIQFMFDIYIFIWCHYSYSQELVFVDTLCLLFLLIFFCRDIVLFYVYVDVFFTSIYVHDYRNFENDFVSHSQFSWEFVKIYVPLSDVNLITMVESKAFLLRWKFWRVYDILVVVNAGTLSRNCVKI